MSGQESIPVGCVLPACQPNVLQWPDGGGGPKVNKFKQISSVSYQMSVARGGPQVIKFEHVGHQMSVLGGPRPDVWGREGGCTVQ